jgi:hypothetical protein
VNYQSGPGPVDVLGALIVFGFMLACIAVGAALMGKFVMQIAQGLCV